MTNKDKICYLWSSGTGKLKITSWSVIVATLALAACGPDVRLAEQHRIRVAEHSEAVKKMILTEEKLQKQEALLR
ncbi:MAG: hypothetical protein M3Y27_20430, partial [Acidobacteriota bacterium]|nr:hypothetical protein [Acidobacteriota bacterium]